MGQGIITSLAQMLADELDVSLDSVDMVMGDTDLCPYDRGTYGSMSTRFFGPPLRSAGAKARKVLLQMASEILQIPVRNLKVKNGVISADNKPNSEVTYAQLAKGKKIVHQIEERVSVKDTSEFSLMGKPVTRRDAREKVTGKAKYAGDIKISDMLYAKILRPPAHDSNMIHVDISESEKMNDVLIVRENNLIAVLSKDPERAEKALQTIKSQFSKPSSYPDDTNIFDHLLKVAPEGEEVAKDGSIQKGEESVSSILEETYLDGYVAHAPIEPHTAVAQIEGEKVTVWASTQTPFGAKEEAAEAIGVPLENVRVITPFVGGGFGGKTRNLQVSEAVRLAKRTGKPVQVAWSRDEEFFYDSFRPAAIVKIKSGITDKGKIGLWDYRVYFAGERGSEHFYTIPHHRTTSYGSGWGGTPGSHPFATGAWRAPANNTNTFARESQIEIMAEKAKMDPLEFRLSHLKEKRMRNVLTAVGEKFDWVNRKKQEGIGFGIACGIDAGTYVATMAEVNVDKNSGRVQVERVVCAQDMGIVINPEGATIQMEGCITMGLGYALSEDLHFKGGMILDRNFDTYELPRFSWLPKIETVIVENKDLSPQGGGEPAIITMGGVIANAIYDAIGARIFQLPMTPERIKAVLAKG
jgi:isoquinoline 1-oxidoreductase